MQLQLAFASIPPLIAFVALRPLGGTRVALWAAIAVAALEWIYDSLQLGFVEPFTLTSLLLFAVCCGLSIRRDDLLYFKLHPVVFESLVAGAFFYSNLILAKPLFATIVQEHAGLIEALPPWQRGYFESYTLTLSRSVPFLLLAHAGLTAWAALRLSFWSWFWVRVAGLYAMLVLLFLAERILQVSC